MTDCIPLNKCVACGSDNLTPLLDLGEQPLANSYKLTRDQEQKKYPLAVNRCKWCCHVQLTHSVNPKLMFEDYLYVSGTSKTMHKHFEDFVEFTDKFVSSDKKTRSVLDIGCNDGTQLDYYKNKGYVTFGVDPAANLVEETAKRHIAFTDWFNDAFVEKFGAIDRDLDTIVAQNVFAHGPEPAKFLEAAKKLMNDDTVLFIQTSQANMIRNNEFDTIYHEHVSFFSVLSMKALCDRVGLHLFDIHYMPIHGTSYVFCISKNPREGNVNHVIRGEAVDGLYDDETFDRYAARAVEVVDEFFNELSLFIEENANNPYLIVGYGAPAKGMTFLNYSGVYLSFIVDDSPLKQGRFTPGSSIQIVSSDELSKYDDVPICFVPLAWNFFDEIVSKIKTLRKNDKDRFITYFPKAETRK